MSRLFLGMQLLSSVALMAQSHPVKITADPANPEKINIYGQNDGFGPYTILLNVEEKNMQTNDAYPKSIVIPADGEKHVLSTLIPEKNKRASFSFTSAIHLGDRNATHDDDFAYRLPYRDGETYPLTQGYNGKFSHANKYALDFTMPEGTPVCAARGGTVIDVKEDSNAGCRSSRCKDDANYILILHDDGSYGEYVHLCKDGSTVVPGATIKKGEVIGYSGNTGWSSGPHLHFSVFVGSENGRETLPTRFQAREVTGELEVGRRYTAE